MATCSDTLTRALRRLRIIDERESPTAEHGVAGMAALNGLFDRYVNTAALTDYVATAAYTAEENQRIRLSGGAWTITYPTTISAENRDPYDLSVVIVAGASPVSKIYDAQLATWVTVNGLVLATVCPLSLRNSTALVGALAEALSGEYGRAMDATLIRDAAHGKQLLSRIGGRPYSTPKYY